MCCALGSMSVKQNTKYSLRVLPLDYVKISSYKTSHASSRCYLILINTHFYVYIYNSFCFHSGFLFYFIFAFLVFFLFVLRSSRTFFVAAIFPTSTTVREAFLFYFFSVNFSLINFACLFLHSFYCVQFDSFVVKMIK